MEEAVLTTLAMSVYCQSSCLCWLHDGRDEAPGTHLYPAELGPLLVCGRPSLLNEGRHA